MQFLWLFFSLRWGFVIYRSKINLDFDFWLNYNPSIRLQGQGSSAYNLHTQTPISESGKMAIQPKAFITGLPMQHPVVVDHRHFAGKENINYFGNPKYHFTPKVLMAQMHILFYNLPAQDIIETWI